MYVLQRVPMETICKMLGHKDVKMTQRYARVTQKKRILRFDKIKTNGIRIVFDSARACPCINNVSAY